MNKRIEILVHAAVWAILLLLPLTFFSRGNSINMGHYLIVSMSTLLMMVVFYVDYLWLTPHYFVKRKHRFYWLCNIVIVVCLGIFLHYWMAFAPELFSTGGMRPRHHEPDVLATLLIILRGIFNLAIAAAVATAIVLAMQWQKAETARKDAEAARTKAELSNLRSQINPHFLLNTLNNIYALTAFDATKAQEAIQELSKMLRHILYDNQQPKVSLKDEAEFLENYIKLMRIRIPESVDINYQLSIINSQLAIAPMIFISLVENAFKHGISPTEPSFIHIRLEADQHTITCDIRNSNHPKTASDHSGHGIGLQQVQRRLDLSYPGRYEWKRGVSEDGKTYHSQITLQL